MTPIELRDKSAALLDRLADRLPAAELSQLRRYNAVGEWGVLVDELTAALVQDGIAVRPSERDALRELLYAFEPPGQMHKYIARRDEVLTQLVVEA
jgi:hypothetical protein